ncbi:cilia- and flagella-associated protein 54 isoform X2 [Scyliorhinus canicula]|uniref:cilia- and flagella-associated protein 54 isoform X2 n=1 Tax=Scyliorhinus canicula TaxID=7830 RepID=UPI0018F5E6C3|nr:cilia- and flagella-associated protein 54 isoform X2 [Scyliorhinus canicula]
MEPMPAKFYGKLDEKNPVVASLEQKLNHFMKNMESATSHNSYTRGANDLSCIWNTYEKLLPDHYYHEKLLKIGDFLQQMKLHSLQMNSICNYNIVKEADPRLLKLESQSKCTSILKFLRLIMQVALPKEPLCWLIFNGTIYIYTICRHLMVLALYAKAFEYILWAAICMETSFPLSTVRYLRWRTTLYTAVCQCYYDCECDIVGETFARRALGKISELSQLETMHPSPQTHGVAKIFREATVKVSVMIFKRAVIESRRKPKGILRPKQRTNYKESHNLPWPHNPTEQLLAEMFQGSAAQFLAITETLSGASRRVLQTKPPTPSEHEVFDVTTELFLAGILLLSGGGGNTQLNAAACTDPVGGINISSSLIELAATGEDGVSVEAAVRFVKSVFCYEYLEIFDGIIAPLLTFLRKHENPAWRGYELDLDLLITMEPFVSARKPRHGLSGGGSCAIGGTIQPGGTVISCDDLVILAEAMFAYTCTPLEGAIPDIDMVVDAVLFLWQKCKTVLQRGNFGIIGSTKYLKKMDNFGKWMHILSILQEVTIWCHLGDVDPVVLVDITLYSAGLLETLADSCVKSKRKPGNAAAHEIQSDTATSTQTAGITIQTEHCSPTNILTKHPAEQLDIACRMLEKGLDSIEIARSATVSVDKTSLCDTSCMKLDNYNYWSSSLSNQIKESDVPEEDSSKVTALGAFIMDLHLELFQVYYRVAFKLLKMNCETPNYENYNQETIGPHENYGFTISTEADIIKKVKKNNVLKAVFLIQKVMFFYNKDHDQSSRNHLLEKAATLLQKAEAEEKMLYLLSTQQPTTDNQKLGVVPAPILLSRSHNSMIFKPAHFTSSEKVCWYRIFARTATGSILKVRLQDSMLRGTGHEVPAFGECLLEVKGIEPNEKYIFAVAGYSEDGTIIGDEIGHTTKPILAYYPLPILTAWTSLCQAAYQLGHYSVSKLAFSVLWEHFVSQECQIPADEGFVSDQTKCSISQKSLNKKALSLASPILLRNFLGSIFIDSDISCQEDAIYCDTLSDNGPLYKGQLRRLAKCERMLIVIEIAGWINDANQALQAVVQCYGLLAPMIFHRIPSTPVVQILTKCLCVLQDVIGAYRQRKQFGITESLQHMTACVTFYLAKILQCWKEYNLALEVVIIGKEILFAAIQETAPEQKAGGTEDEAETMQNKWENTIDQEKLAIENSMHVKSADDALADLESKEALTRSEAVIYTTILFAPITVAYNAVMKFKEKNRFLEYFVLLLHRLVREEYYTQITDWVNDVIVSLRRRNKGLLGKKKTSGKKTPSKPLKNTAVVVEYHNTPSKKPKKEKITLRELVQSFHKNPAYKLDQNAYRKQKEKLEKKAKEVFRTLLRPIISRYLRLKKFNKFCMIEMPWRSQLNMLLGILCFHSFMKYYEDDTWTSKNISRYSILDPEIFTLHSCGGLLLNPEIHDSDIMQQIPVTSMFAIRKKEKSTDSDQGWNDAISESTESSHTPVTQIGEESDSIAEEVGKPSTRAILMFDQLGKSFLHIKRAVVLAHRGGHWTALQNACRFMWNCAHNAMMYITSVESLKETVLTTDRVKNIFCLPFYLAAQTLLDMVVQLQNTYSNIKFVDPNGIFSVPSCVGSISDDHGGYSLKFEQPLDDVNVVDLHLVCSLALYSIELLCHQKKWESLVFLAIHFNAVTHERFTEKVTPFLVFAQHQLRKRIREFNGPAPPQPHFVKAAEEGTVINSRNFHRCQLKISMSAYQDGSFDLDKNVSSGSKSANALVSVPVNTMDTLSSFRESLLHIKYVSSALRHSRKLLALLLAYTQQKRKDIMKRVPGTVGFTVSPTPIESSKPADLSTENFLVFDDILCKPLPQSQIPLVILSYANTIELLQMNGQKSLCAQALHEQGNVYFYAGNRRAAFRCWCHAIDAIFNTTDFINNWKNSESSNISLEHSKDYSEFLLDQAGIWGCLLAGVLSAKIAQLIISSDFSFRIDCCILSSFLFKGLFRTTFPHPRSDREYASYEVGFDCAVVELIPGIDLFSDRFRADVRTVVGSLDFVIHELHSVKQNLKALPLLTLYQYFVSAICRDVHRSVQARILKGRVLTDLSLFTEAFDEQCTLLNGGKLPHALLDCFRFPDSKIQMTFDQSKSLLSDNLLAIQDLLSIPLSQTLRSLYGPYLVNKFELGRTNLAIKLAETINCIPETSHFLCSNNLTNPDDRTIDLDTDYVHLMTELKDMHGFENTCQSDIKRLDLYSFKNRLKMSQLKEFMLSEAQNKLNIFMDTIKLEYNVVLANLAPAELEMTIDAKCQAAAIALQRLQLAFSAAIALSAIQLLKRSKILVTQKQYFTKNPSTAFKNTMKTNTSTEDQVTKILYQEPHNVEACARLHLGLWLKCRLVLLTAVTSQLYGIGLKTDEGFLEAARLCEEGIEEAKANGLVELQTEFMLQAVLLDFRLGRVKDYIKTLLQKIIELLNTRRFISPSAQMILAQAILQLTDLRKTETLCTSKDVVMQEKISQCLSAQKLIIDQLVSLGESVQHQANGRIYSMPVFPLKNIYLPHIILLAKIKLRLGSASAQLTVCSAERWNSASWQEPHSCFSTGLNLCKNAASKEYDVEAEILFQKGKILRQIAQVHYEKTLEAANCFMEAINITYCHEQNLWLMRQAYLELVLLYFNLDEDEEKEAENSLKHEMTLENKLSVKSGLILVPKAPKKKITGQGRLIEILQYVLKAPSKYKLLAWVAIRAANEIVRTMSNTQILIRDQAVDEENIKSLVHNILDEFVILDTFASHHDYQTENDELLPTLTAIQGVKVEEKGQENKEMAPVENPNMMASYRKAAEKLKSIQLLHYINHLHRLYNINLLPVRNPVENVETERTDNLGHNIPFTEPSEAQMHGVDIDFKKCAINDVEDGVRTPVFNTSMCLRLALMHIFLKTYLPSYKVNCSADLIPVILYEMFDGSFMFPDFHPEVYTSVFGEFVLTSPKDSYTGQLTPQMSIAVHSIDKELCVQWYLPALALPPASCETQKILLLFAYNVKPVTLISLKTSTLTNASCGYKWIHLKRLISLHKKLSALKQKAEAYLKPEHAPSSSLQRSQNRTKQRYSRSESTTNVRKLPILLEDMVMQLCREIKELFVLESDMKPEAEVPFDLSFDTLEQLEQVFNPAVGYTLKYGSLFKWLISFMEME